MAKDPATIAARWSQGLAGAGAKITEGVASVTTAPGQMAARQKAVYAQNVAASVDKWAANVGKVTLGDWQSAMTNKGIARIATGASAAQDKFAGFITKLLPHIAAGKASLPPRGTFEQNVQRSVAWIQHMHKFSK